MADSMMLNTGVRTLRTQDTSDLRQFGTSWTLRPLHKMLRQFGTIAEVSQGQFGTMEAPWRCKIRFNQFIA